MKSQQRAPVTIVSQFIDCINRQDVGGLIALMAADHRFIDATGTVHERDAMTSGWGDYFSSFPDYRIDVEHLASDGLSVSVFGWASGTASREPQSAAPRAWRIPAAWRAVVRDGKLRVWRVYCDVEPMLRSMGVDRLHPQPSEDQAGPVDGTGTAGAAPGSKTARPASYARRLDEQKDLIAMIHLDAMPGTPLSTRLPGAIVSRAVDEARLYQRLGVATVMIENMHDVPYVKEAGAEVSALMAVAGKAIKELGLHCGVQVLAGRNREAVGVAHAAGLDFVRVEGYVFGHVGDEGFFEACAGDLLRYRKAIGAQDVLVFADIKKKHSSHAITADVDLLETARAARFFLADGVVVTGVSTGTEADPELLRTLKPVPVRKLVGSGITAENLATYYDLADAFIVGSSLKTAGLWSNPPEPGRVERLVAKFDELKRARSRPAAARRSSRTPARAR